MNDLDVLESVQRFRADVPEPDRDHVREARRVFHTALADANARPAPRRSPLGMSWRIRVPVMAGAAATLAAALAIGVVGIPGGGPSVNPAAAARLTAAADAVAVQPESPVLQDGQFWFERSVFWQAAAASGDPEHDALNPEQTGTYERWIALDGTQRIASDMQVPEGYEEAEFDFDDRSTGEELWIGTDAGGTYEDILALPTDTDGLYAHVERVTRDMDGNDRPVHVQMFVLVRDLLREPMLPNDLREALYRVAARIPGVQVTEGVTDHLDRTGTALWMVEDDSGYREEFIIDPATGEPLAERSLDPDGSVGYESAVVEWGVVDSIETRL